MSEQEKPPSKDLFDDIVLSEELLFQEGFESGYKQGTSEGNVEAFHLGYHRGAEIGAELGYYYSVSRAHVTENEAKENDKVVKAFSIVIKLIEEFPTDNLEDVDLFGSLEKIRGAYKKACSHSKFDSSYSEADKLNF